MSNESYNNAAQSLSQCSEELAAFGSPRPSLFEQGGSFQASRQPLVSSVSHSRSLKFIPEKAAEYDVNNEGCQTYSMRNNALYLATRSLRAGAPVLI